MPLSNVVWYDTFVKAPSYIRLLSLSFFSLFCDMCVCSILCLCYAISCRVDFIKWKRESYTHTHTHTKFGSCFCFKIGFNNSDDEKRNRECRKWNGMERPEYKHTHTQIHKRNANRESQAIGWNWMERSLKKTRHKTTETDTKRGAVANTKWSDLTISERYINNLFLLLRKQQILFFFCRRNIIRNLILSYFVVVFFLHRVWKVLRVDSFLYTYTFFFLVWLWHFCCWYMSNIQMHNEWKNQTIE